jgi:O-antigen/teichoic acid export membrane protein
VSGLRARLAQGRLILMVGGEAMQSALNFALNLALLHVLPAKEFGVFALVMVIGGVGLTYIRALTAMPAAILIGQASRPGRAAIHDVTFGSAALLLSAAMAASVAIVLSAWVESGAWAGGVFVGLWAFRSHLRTVYFADERRGIVGIGDLAYTFCGSLTAAAIWAGADILRNVLLILAAANALAIAVMLLRARRRVRVSFGRRTRRRYLGIGRQLAWSALSVTTTNLQGQGMALMVAALAGPAAYAPIAAALVVFVPLRIVATALANMKQPELSANLARNEIRMVRRSVLAWMAAMALGGLAYGVGIALVLPMVAPGFTETSSPLVLALAWIFYTLTMVSVMPRIMLEILGEFRSITMITVGSAVLGMGLSLLILLTEPPSLALIGGVVSELSVLAASGMVVWLRIHTLRHGDLQASPFDRAPNGGATPPDRGHCLFALEPDERLAEQGTAR